MFRCGAEFCPGVLFIGVCLQNTRQARVRELKSRREDAATQISAVARGRRDRRRSSEMRHENEAAILIQKAARGRQGRANAKLSIQQQHAMRREEGAAIKIQKLARGNSERRLHQQAKDRDEYLLYGVKGDGNECETGAGAACLPHEEGTAPTEHQLKNGGSQPEGVGTKRVEFLTNPCAREEVASQLALDLDEGIKSFVAVQATVRRYEARVEEATAIRRASAGSEPSGKDKGPENGMEIDRDVLASKERENEPEPDQDMSESDFVIGSSLSGSIEQDANETDDREEEAWKSDFVLDDSSEATLAHENIAEIPQHGEEEGLDGESEKTHTILEGVHVGEGKLLERGTEQGLDGSRSDFVLDNESESAATSDTRHLAIDRDEEQESEEPRAPEGEEEPWKSDFAVDVLESPSFQQIDEKNEEATQSWTASDVDKASACYSNEHKTRGAVADDGTAMPIKSQDVEASTIPNEVANVDGNSANFKQTPVDDDTLESLEHEVRDVVGEAAQAPRSIRILVVNIHHAAFGC